MRQKEGTDLLKVIQSVNDTVTIKPNSFQPGSYARSAQTDGLCVRHLTATQAQGCRPLRLRGTEGRAETKSFAASLHQPHKDTGTHTAVPLPILMSPSSQP